MGSPTMTRDELKTVVARAIIKIHMPHYSSDEIDVAYEDVLDEADAALSAIERAGFKLMSENDLDELRVEYREIGWEAACEASRE